MGFFSWDCKCCGESIKSGNDWMGKAVAVSDDGSVVSGEYDGYGRLETRLGEVELVDAEGHFALYHAKCYTLAGKPGYNGPSRSAADQGCGKSEKEPETLADIADIKRRSARRAKDRAKSWQKSKTKMVADYQAKGEPVPEWLQD
jgi:hypothetical protein